MQLLFTINTHTHKHIHRSQISLLTHCGPDYYCEFQQSVLKLNFEKISIRQRSKSAARQQEFSKPNIKYSQMTCPFQLDIRPDALEGTVQFDSTLDQ